MLSVSDALQTNRGKTIGNRGPSAVNLREEPWEKSKFEQQNMPCSSVLSREETTIKGNVTVGTLNDITILEKKNLKINKRTEKESKRKKIQEMEGGAEMEKGNKN